MVNAATGQQHELPQLRRPEAGYGPKIVCVLGAWLFYVQQCPRQSDYPVWAVNWAKPGAPERLTPCSADDDPLVRGNVAVVLCRQRRELWTLSLTSRTCRKTYALPDGFDFPIFDLSPGGERLAVGTTNQKHGKLAVVDLGTRKTLRVWKTLNIRDWNAGLYVPQLPVGWSNAAEVLSVEYCGSNTGWGGYTAVVCRSVATGEVLGRTECDAELLNSPQRLSDVGSAPVGYFLRYEEAGPQLFCHGREHPVQPMFPRPGRDLSVSPDGRYALESTDRDGGSTRLHRLGREPITLQDRAMHGVSWLPAHRRR